MANAALLTSFKRTSACMLAAAVLFAGPVEARGIFDKVKSIFGSDAASTAAGALSNDDIASGLKEALRVGADNVVGQLGSADGFWKDEAIRIALPGPLEKVDSALSRFGMGSLTDSVKEKMNRAAEAAVPEAKELFITAISDMSITDAKDILTGGDDAATQYFKTKMSPELRTRMAPIVTTAMSDVGVLSAAQTAVNKVPMGGSMVPNLEEEVTNHVLDGAIDGVFYYLAKEEAAIRNNPAERTTAILKKVFG